MARSNKGRQRIEMKKMKNESNLQVTFSKRRFGLFKKASELCTLTGAEILMIVFSPGGKVFSFGQPGVKDLIDRFLNRNHNNSVIPRQLVETRPDMNIQYLNQILTEALAVQEKEKHKKIRLDKLRESREQRGNYWYEKDVKQLGLNETDNLIYALQDVKKKLVSEIMPQPSQVHVSQTYLGESSGFIVGRNVDFGTTDLFHHRGNTFNYNPTMDFPNHTPLFGSYNNNGVTVPRSSMNYMSPSYNFNEM